MKEGYGRACSNLTRTRWLRVRPCKGFLSPQTPPGAWLPFPWICLQAPTCRQASVGTLVAGRAESFLKEVPLLPASHVRRWLISKHLREDGP